jgi:hypothetical protein
MIRSLILFFTISVFFTCKPDQKHINNSSEHDAIQQNNDSKITLQGSWINEAYYNSIRSDKSPQRAQITCEMCLINMPATTQMMAEIVVNFHEIIDYVLIQNENQQYELWEGEPGKPVRFVEAIQISSKNKIKVSDNTFVRIPSAEPIRWNSILNVLLFQGTYETDEGGKVHFLASGEISGLEAYSYYEPLFDYFDVGRNVDQIKLGKSKDTMETFAFRFKNKKLQLYRLKCLSEDDTGTCVEVGFGKPLFNLEKEK